MLKYCSYYFMMVVTTQKNKKKRKVVTLVWNFKKTHTLKTLLGAYLKLQKKYYLYQIAIQNQIIKKA